MRLRKESDDRQRKERKEREEALARARDIDVARGRLESWSGGRVRPMLNDEG